MMNKFNNSHNKKRNIFLSLLRMHLSFLVVNSHFYKPSQIFIKNKFLLFFIYSNYHVPIFFIMSFYFCLNLFKSKNIQAIKLRYQRIMIPYFIWPIFIWFFNNFFYFILKFNIEYYSFNDLKIQLLTGHVYMRVLWFQYNLILSTTIILIIEFLFIKNNIILFNIIIFSYFIQYSNFNFIFFSKYDYHWKYTFGRFFEIIPYCISGYILASLKIINYLTKNRIKFIYLIIFILILIKKCNIFRNIKGFFYQGLNLYFISLGIFMIFLLLPSEKINNLGIRKIITNLSNYTSGVYYLHYHIGLYMENYIRPIKNKSISGCIIIYIISYALSFIGLLLFRNTKFKHLFQ